MTYRGLFTREFVKQLEKLDRTVHERIQRAIDTIRVDPYHGKRLTGVLSGRWSYRVGDYRILYKIYSGKRLVPVLTVGHRREVYR